MELRNHRAGAGPVAVIFGVLAMAVAAIACAGPSTSPAGTDTPGSTAIAEATEPMEPEVWGAEAEEFFEHIAQALEDGNNVEVANILASGGRADLTTIYGDVAMTPEQVASRLLGIWFMRPPRRDNTSVLLEQVHLGRRSAVARFVATDDLGAETWMQLHDVSTSSEIATRVYWVSGFVPEATQLMLDNLYARYVAWRAHADDADVVAVYTPDAVVRDAMTGDTKVGIDDIEELNEDSPAVHDGPWPRLAGYESSDLVEAIAVVQLAGECPMLEASRWVIENGLIADETRFLHAPSARRCGVEADDGWWVDYEPPKPFDGVLNDRLDVGNMSVALINAGPGHSSFVHYLFDRYETGGIELPLVTAVRFPPSIDCASYGGLAIKTDTRYVDGHTVLICFEASELYSTEPGAGWLPTAVDYGLHELGHVWLFDHADAQLEADFMARAGLVEWRGDDVPSHERGVEHAATTIAWGVAGDDYARYSLRPVPSCEELALRFQLLTGQWPATQCAGAGGT